VAALKVGVRGIDLTVFELIAKVMGAEAVKTVMTAL